MSSIRSQDTRLTYKTQLHFYALNNELSKNEIKKNIVRCVNCGLVIDFNKSNAFIIDNCGIVCEKCCNIIKTQLKDIKCKRFITAYE